MFIVTLVHLRIVRCHHSVEDSPFLEWGNPPWEVCNWWGGECSTDPAVRLIVDCGVGVTPGQEGISWGSNGRLRAFGVSRSRLTYITRPIWKVQSQSIESQDIKWRHLVLVRVPPLNSSVMHPWINFCHFDSCGRRKNNLIRAFPERIEELPLWSPFFFFF